MKKLIIVLTGIILLSACNKKDEPEDIREINDNTQYWYDFYPDLQLTLNDSLVLDIDHNGVQDIIFKLTQSWPDVARINDSVEISMGIFIGSGSGNLVTIAHNEIIDDSQEWYAGFSLFTQTIKYVGVKKTNANQSSFGWIEVNVSDSTLTIKELYFRKESNTIIKAGIKEYN